MLFGPSCILAIIIYRGHYDYWNKYKNYISNFRIEDKQGFSITWTQIVSYETIGKLYLIPA